MSEAMTLFWDFGSLYFGFLSDVVIFGISFLCYVLGAFLIAQILFKLVKVAPSISFNKRYK